MDTIDFWVGSVLLFVMGALQVIFFSWVFGAERAKVEAHRGAQIEIPRPMWFVIKYLSPLFVIVVFVGFCIQKLGDSVRSVAASPTAQLAIALIVAVVLGLSVVVLIGERRWRAAGIDIDDRERADIDGGAK